MRYLAALFTVLVLAACGTAQTTRSASRAASPARVRAPELQKASINSVVLFLLTSAASDFHNHPPTDPVRVRDVRLGHLTTPGGEKRYMLCGQFLPEQGGDKARWTPFVTIKTSGYEQYLGPQAVAFSRDSTIVWDKVSDLSSSLQSRLDSLH